MNYPVNNENLVTALNSVPEDHPGDDDDAEGDEGGHVEDGDGAEGPRAPVHVLDHHQLPDVQEDGVDLQDHADRRAADVLPRVEAGKQNSCSCCAFVVLCCEVSDCRPTSK